SRDPFLTASALRDVAPSFWKEGDRRRAYWNERRRMALLIKSGSANLVASGFQNLGILSMDRGRHAQARKYYRLAFRYPGNTITASTRGSGLINLAETYRCQGLFKTAANAIRRGISHISISGEAQRLAVAQLNLAQIMANAGYPRECRRLLDHSLRRPEV